MITCLSLVWDEIKSFQKRGLSVVVHNSKYSTIVHSWSQKFTYSLQNHAKCTKIHVQNTCCCLFSTDLNKIFHIKYVYIQYSPQEKIIAEFIKITLFKSLHTLDSSHCVVTWMIHSCVFLFSDSCSWVPCLSWTVKLPAVLQKNPSGPTNSLLFQHFCVFEPFPTMTVWFWDPSFHWGQPRDSYATITEGSNAHWCSRRKNHALRGGEGGF